MQKSERGAQIRSAILSGFSFAVFMGVFWAYQDGYKMALISAPIAGSVFGLTMYLFARSKWIKQQTEVKVSDDNAILMSGAANHFFNREAVGGKLYLFGDKLLFKSHSLNIQNHELEISIGDIVGVDFYNTLGLVPNGLVVSKRDGTQEKFVVNNRSTWKHEILSVIDTDVIKVI